MKNKRRNISSPSPASTQAPIFIHSLWRTGSTYLYSVFRRSPSGYWCYQEPIHEIALACKDAPDGLLSFTGDRLKALRHPNLAKPYFQELFEIWPSWKNDIHKSVIYDQYFDRTCSQELTNYLNRLISNAKGHTVIQECRTSCRIKAIKKHFSGTHLYLWRNPWDQWWSYKVTGYFDVKCLQILNAPDHPDSVARLRSILDFSEYHNDDIFNEYDYFDQRRLTAENSYLTFYLIWCLGLLEGISNADLLINIDSLSTSSEYQQATVQKLQECGVPGIDFSDCSVFQGNFSPREKVFFATLEEQIHSLLLDSGYQPEQIDSLLAHRSFHEPSHAPSTFNAQTIALLSETERIREIVIRCESESSDLLKKAAHNHPAPGGNEHTQHADTKSREKTLLQQASLYQQEIARLLEQYAQLEQSSQNQTQANSLNLLSLHDEMYKKSNEASARERALTRRLELYHRETTCLLEQAALREREFNEHMLEFQRQAENTLLEQVHRHQEDLQLLQQRGQDNQELLINELQETRREAGEREQYLQSEISRQRSELTSIANDFKHLNTMFIQQQTDHLQHLEEIQHHSEQRFFLQYQELTNQITEIRDNAEQERADLLHRHHTDQQRLSNIIGQLHKALTEVESSWSWRLAKTLRRSISFICGKPTDPDWILDHINFELSLPSDPVNSKPVTTSIYHLLPPEYDMMPFGSSKPAKTLDELLAYHDHAFVRRAFLDLLGREPDQTGLSYYLARVRNGVSKIEILAQLRLSSEGRLRKPGVSGLDNAISRFRWLRRPLIGPLLMLFGLKSEQGIVQRLRSIENWLALAVTNTGSIQEIEKRLESLARDSNSHFQQMNCRLTSILEAKINRTGNNNGVATNSLCELQLQPHRDNNSMNFSTEISTVDGTNIENISEDAVQRIRVILEEKGGI